MNGYKQDGLKILCLPIRPCSWKRYPQIEQYQSVGSVNPTLAEMGEVERDRVMVGITDHIHDLFERIEAERQAAQQADAAEALARRQEAERQIAAREAGRLAEDTARLERLKAENEARAEAERWRIEAAVLRAENDRTRAQMERLAKEKAELQRQATLNMPQPSAQPEVPSPRGPSLIQIPATRGWLVLEGNEWRKKEEPITVPGYKQTLREEVAITMVQIPEGSFLMGSPPNEDGRYDDEGPQHRVTLPRFFLGQMLVSQAQWKVVAGWPKQELELNPDPSRFKGPNRPVETVSWEEAQEFCKRLSQRCGMDYTLPSQAQWEYACRAGTTTAFHYGETISAELANYSATTIYGNGPMGEYRQRTTDVASFPANPWGLYDMHGNVWEWCADHWHANYVGAPEDGRPWLDEKASNDQMRLLRGGSWFIGPQACRSAYRLRCHPGIRDNDGGFRVCCLPQD